MASPPVTAIWRQVVGRDSSATPFRATASGSGRRQASIPVSEVVSHHPASTRARKMIGAATVRAPRGLFRVATTYFPTPGVRAAQQTHGCVSCTPPIRTLTVGAGISPAQPPSFCEGGSRTITAGSDFHRPRSTRVPLCHRRARDARRIRHERKSRPSGRLSRSAAQRRDVISGCERWRVRAAPQPLDERLPRGRPRNQRRSCRRRPRPRARSSRGKCRHRPGSIPAGPQR